MRHTIILLNFQFVLLLILLAGCASDASTLPPPLPGGNPGEGEAPVTLAFDGFCATAGSDSAATSRATAAAVTGEPMAVNKIFRIYAYYAGTTDLSTPLDSRIYTVQSSESGPSVPGKATGDLTLYRGRYDLYLMSYNSDTEAPVLRASGTAGIFEESNGKDFMYTKLEGIVVQPDQTGSNLMVVSLPRPFTRMGSRVITTVKAASSQPVAMQTLNVNYIKISGLSDGLTYELGNPDWNAGTGYNESITYNHFTGNPNQYTDPFTSEAQVLLPVDGSQMLSFEVNLTVGYNGTSLTSSYPATIQKVMLPGMTYQFDFTLTFYGALTPVDLTLAVKAYNTVTLVSDGLGGDTD